jgi:hypothetical protein
MATATRYTALEIKAPHNKVDSMQRIVRSISGFLLSAMTYVFEPVDSSEDTTFMKDDARAPLYSPVRSPV